MTNLIQIFNKSLRLRLIFFLFLISTFLLVLGTWIAYQQIHQNLDAQIKSDAVLVSRFINHTAMATRDRKVLQHTLMEVYKETPLINLMLVAEKNSNYVIAATIPEWIGLQANELPDEQLAGMLDQSLKADSFTQLFESGDNNLTIITALDQSLSSHINYSEDHKQIQAGSSIQEKIHAENEIDTGQENPVENPSDHPVSALNQVTEAAHKKWHEMIDEGSNIRPGNDDNSNIHRQWQNLGDFPNSSIRPLPTPLDSSRGSIIVIFDRIPSMMQAKNDILIQGGTIAVLILILAIVIYFKVASLVLKPVEKLIEAMREQTASDRHASPILTNSDNIGDLAENFNTIISMSQEENVRLKKNMTDIIEEELNRWRLTKTEKEIAFLLIKGFSMQEIGEKRNVKEKSVRQQATGIYTKAEVSNRYELTSYFIEDLLKPQIP